LNRKTSSARRKSRTPGIYRTFFRRYAVPRQATSRKKRSPTPANDRTREIQHSTPFIEVRIEQTVGPSPLEFKGVKKSYGDLKVINGFSATSIAAKKSGCSAATV